MDQSNPVPANDREAVFYQHTFAENFFSYLCKSEIDRLDQIPLSREYPAPAAYDPETPQHIQSFDKSKNVFFFYFEVR